MPYKHISVEPMNPVIGAEITGVDLTKPLTDEVFGEIHDAWLKHLVVFFRDQALGPKLQRAFAQRFGELHVHPHPKVSAPEGYPEIVVIHADEKSKMVPGQGWHSDVSCDEIPPKTSILHMKQVPPSGGGDTLFANMYAAYDALSKSMKSFLSDMKAVHASDHVYAGRTGAPRDEEHPRNEHPVIRTHPETGRKALYVNSGFTTHIRGRPKAESSALLQFLFTHIQNPHFHCRFRWKVNSVAVWDNRCAQHFALGDYFPHVRHAHRISVLGDRP